MRLCWKGKTMADMRDRLIELLESARYWGCGTSTEIADHLLANGVILLPCKVGERIHKVYADCYLPGDCYTTRMCSECEYVVYGIEEAFFEFYMLNKNGELPPPYYVTREEAEKALRNEQ